MTPPNNIDAFTLISVLIISAVSGSISILRRIAEGQAVSIVWFLAEFLAAILCGYLAYDTYPAARAYIPDWITMPVFVAVSAHTGGRLLQIAEQTLYTRLPGVKK